MGMNPAKDSGSLRQSLHHGPHIPIGKCTTLKRAEHWMPGLESQFFPTIQPAVNHRPSTVIQSHDPGLVTLPVEYSYRPSIRIQIFGAESKCFVTPEPTPVHHGQQCPVPDSGWSMLGCGLDETPNLIGGERFRRQFPPLVPRSLRSSWHIDISHV